MSSDRARKGQAGLERRFEREAIEAVGETRGGELTPAQRQHCVDIVRRLHFRRLGYAASRRYRAPEV